MLAALILFASNTIDYSTVAKRTELIVEDLAKVTGRRLACSSQLRDEVVFIQVHSVEQDELLQKIAFVLRADWHLKDDVLTLERDNAWIAANEREDEQTIKKVMTRQFDLSFPGARAPVPKEALDQLAL